VGNRNGVGPDKPGGVEFLHLFIQKGFQFTSGGKRKGFQELLRLVAKVGAMEQF